VKAENPKFATGRLHLGLSYYSLGRRTEAAEEWEQVMALAPDNKSAQMYLAMIRQGPTAAPDASAPGKAGANAAAEQSAAPRDNDPDPKAT
jgi:Tfp pilus assembly protein PilF